MLNHIIIFWLKDDFTENQLREFRAGLEVLKEIEHVNALYLGTPAKTAKRPVIDNSYDIGVTILFDSVEPVSERIVGANDLVFVPSMEPHSMKNISEMEAATFLCCIANVYEEDMD